MNEQRYILCPPEGESKGGLLSVLETWHLQGIYQLPGKFYIFSAGQV